MFIREKKTEDRVYLQIVENHREGKRTVQRVIATLGRLDKLLSSGGLDPLARSIARYSKQVRIGRRSAQRPPGGPGDAPDRSGSRVRQVVA
jgi:hypothetical protein